MSIPMRSAAWMTPTDNCDHTQTCRTDVQLYIYCIYRATIVYYYQSWYLHYCYYYLFCPEVAYFTYEGPIDRYSCEMIVYGVKVSCSHLQTQHHQDHLLIPGRGYTPQSESRPANQLNQGLIQPGSVGQADGTLADFIIIIITIDSTKCIIMIPKDCKNNGNCICPGVASFA